MWDFFIPEIGIFALEIPTSKLQNEANYKEYF
jgi:hypothetical protein